MIGIIESWLFSQLGINCNLDKLGDLNIFQDGSVLVDILQKYGLLDANFSVNITPSGDAEICTKNLRLLKPLLNMLKVNYDENVIQDIASNKATSVLKLLYELYICLENKQHLYFITELNRQKVYKKMLASVDMNDVSVNVVESGFSLNPERTCLDYPLMQHRDVIEWYKNKYISVKNRLDTKLSKLKEGVCTSGADTFENKSVKCSCTSCNYEGYEPLPDPETFPVCSNHDALMTYDQFIAKFKRKQRKKSLDKCFENSIQNDLINLTWSKIMEKQNDIYNAVFSESMLKQSQFEKQMLTKLIQTQHQIKIQNENEIHATKLVSSEEEKQINCDTELEEEFQELEKFYEDEQKRVLELHKKLYKEKQDIIKKRHLSLCSDVMESLIDIAVNASEYKSKYGVPVSKNLWNIWVSLFIKSKSIHIPFQKLESVVLQENEVDYDEIIAFERERESHLNDNDVDEYLYTCGRWFREDICIEHSDVNKSILAFIVYRLLAMKYPPPATPAAAALPAFNLAGVLLNFHAPDCIEKLQTLLSKPRVHVFDPDSAIRKCIAAFKQETEPPPGEKTMDKKRKSKSGSAKEKRKGSKKPNSGKKDKKSTNKKGKPEIAIISDKVEELLIKLEDKETQTSVVKEITDKELERTHLGLVGEQVFNVLNRGEKIDDELLVSVIIEYLKTLEDTEGWLILNYPLTLTQASIFELALTGKHLPVEDYVPEVTFEVQLDEFHEKRKSKLLLPPMNKSDLSSFKTQFTVFIRAKENTVLLSEATQKEHETNSFQIEGNSVEENEEELSLEGDLLEPDVMELFYKDQSVFQNFGFDSFDLPTLKKLARTILREDTEGATASVDLFGEECLSKLTLDKKKNKKGKGTSSNKKQQPAGKGKKKSAKVLKSVDQSTVSHQENILVIEETVDLEQTKMESELAADQEVHQRDIHPGEEDWEAITLPINNEIAILLATVWENIENCFINNIKDICFENRMINLRLVPYSTYVQEEVEKVKNKPDLKQNLVNLFLDYYQAIEIDLRTLPEMKNQLYCKVFELQQSLWEIADYRKQEIETKRRDLICENWLVNELCFLMNNHLSLVQTEFDISLETLKFVTDYYLSMLDKSPPSNISAQLVHPLVAKITVETLLFKSVNKLVQNSGSKDDHNPSFDKNSFDPDSNFIAASLINCQERGSFFDSFITIFSLEIKEMLKKLQSLSQAFYTQIRNEVDSITIKNKKLDKGKKLESKKDIKTNTNTEKFKKKNSTSKSMTDNQVVPVNELLLKELEFVLDNEVRRLEYRFDLIDKRGKEEIMEFYCYLESVFCELFESNTTRYNTEISNINKLCDYLRTTIEEELPSVQPLVLDQENFFIDISSNFETKSGYPSLKELLEQSDNCYFTISQLNTLITVFKIAGPYGVIRKQPFCFILQDLMLFNSGNNQPHLPKIWHHLSESQLRTVTDTMLGPEYAIDWRDFIIYNLEIPFPTTEQILSLRKQFSSCDLGDTEVVSLENYEAISLWFEEDLPSSPQEGLRVAMIKKLLFELFKVNKTDINYTALLLYFCKDFDPKYGLKKALSLSLGKNVITSKEELDKMLADEAEMKEIVVSLLEELVNSIIQTREGVLIYEVYGSLTDVNLDENESENSYSTSLPLHSNSSEENQLSSSIKPSLVEESEPLESYKDLMSSFDYHEYNQLDRPWVSKIPFATVINVLNASFLPQDKTYSLRNQYLSCLEEETDSEGMIEAYILVNLSCLQKVFAQTNKFKISSPCDIVKQCLETQWSTSKL